MPWYGWAILAWYVSCSLVAAVLIAVDKRAARRGSWRIPERRLHLAEWIGGWPGAMIARSVTRHKTRKWSYRIHAALACAAHVVLWGVVSWRMIFS